MNREDIIRMALEVGLPHWYHTDGIVNEERVIAFANLVASAAQAKEREACAKVCDEHGKVYASIDQTPATKSAWAACIDNRDAIQAREKT